MPTNAKKFNKRVALRTRKIKDEDLPKAFHATALDALSRVVLKTPVDTGRARGGWQVNLNQAGQGGKVKSKSGARVIQAGAVRISAAKTSDTIFITNGVRYIFDLERGTSKQAPRGMVRVTLAEMKGVLR